MSDPFLASLLNFLLLWAVLFGAYCAAILALDWLIASWRERRLEEKALQDHLDGIDAEAALSVRRLAVAFAIAQQQMRDA
ncbi:hypothetical protein [Mycobacterium sp. 236(2023)]|uniref:hypothetical protein n=1 Tax=Mycobacterium sp. 236(2023) TaxID=3038163 RepID=UPI002414F3C1|nr:hypothetical protein [Mycobacterium sp. 236(2023)]MDG4668661.1 hypothetical protein [Mycobacterium sp. 236(2023)]